jgi:ACS family tartrate transporter-like MFS transporter
MDTLLDNDLGSVVVSKLSRRLLPFLFLLYIVAYLDRINVGFAVLQMQQRFGFSDATYGLGAGMFFAGYFFFQVPSNLVMQRLGARRWIAVIMVLWGIISSSMVLVSTPRSFYLVRFLLGAAEAGFFPGVILYLKMWFPVEAQARTVARFMTAGVLAGVVGGPVSGALLGLDHVLGLAGWQWLFLIEGIPAVFLGGVVLVYLTDYPEDALWLTPEQRTWLTDTLRHERASHPAAGHTSVLAAFGGKVWFHVLLLVCVYFGANMFAYGISLWLPKLIRSLSGVSTFVIGLLSAIPYLAAAVTMMVMGAHSDRTGERRLHVALGAFAGALALGLAAYSSSLVWTIIGLSAALMGVWSIYGPFWAIPSSLLTGTGAAVGIAIINSLGNLGGFFGPWIVGRVRTQTGGFRGGLLAIGAALALSGCAALLLADSAGAAGSKALAEKTEKAFGSRP